MLNLRFKFMLMGRENLQDIRNRIWNLIIMAKLSYQEQNFQNLITPIPEFGSKDVKDIYYISYS